MRNRLAQLILAEQDPVRRNWFEHRPGQTRWYHPLRWLRSLLEKHRCNLFYVDQGTWRPQPHTWRLWSLRARCHNRLAISFAGISFYQQRFIWNIPIDIQLALVQRYTVPVQIKFLALSKLTCYRQKYFVQIKLFCKFQFLSKYVVVFWCFGIIWENIF